MEYGGCLHFELNYSKSEYYSEYDEHKIDIDCGRSGLQYIINKFQYKRIWLPVYNCPLVAKRISEVSDIDIHWYNINEYFIPQINIKDFVMGDAILWVNYCGVMPTGTIDYVVSLQNKCNVKVIIDNIPAYFSYPRMNVINLYSCRKFLGVPDGGHVIGDAVMREQLPTYSTADNYLYLLKAMEDGSNSAYSTYQESEKRFSDADIAYGMPRLTKNILRNIDYESVITRRKNNFLKLHELLGGKNRLVLDTTTMTPSVYPYLSSNKDLRSLLLDNQIYVSRFWKHVMTNDIANNFEKDLAEYLIPLPIDQRYDEKDMIYIAYMVERMQK